MYYCKNLNCAGMIEDAKAAITKECLNFVCWMMTAKFISMVIRQAVMMRTHLNRLIVTARRMAVR